MFQPTVFVGFSGGLNLRDFPHKIQDNQLVEALNVEIDRQGSVSTRPGTTLVNSTIVTLTAGLRTTGLYHYKVSDGSSTVLINFGSSLYKMSPGGPTATNITNSGGLPTNAAWHWVTFNDVAIGVNGAVTGSGVDNPVKVDGVGATTGEAIPGAPRGKYVAVWNNRVFIADADQPNVLAWSAVNDYTDWTTTGILGAGSVNVGGDEGSVITGLKVFRGQLFVFKREYIYVVSAGSPVVDNSQWQATLFADGVGCVSAHTIQQVLDDLVFLSDGGVRALSTSQGIKDVRQGALSDLIPELEKLSHATEDYRSVVLPDRKQYWLAVPGTSTSSTLDVVWVMDFSRLLSDGFVAWTKFTGYTVGTSYAVVYESGVPRVYVGRHHDGVSPLSTSCVVHRYADSGVWRDDEGPFGVPITTRVTTKAFDFGSRLNRKEFLRWAVELSSETAYADLEVEYRFDQDDNRRKVDRHLFTTDDLGGKWDEAVWDTDIWGGLGTLHRDRFSRIIGPAGRRGKTIQFSLQSADQFYIEPPILSGTTQFIVRALRIDAQQLNHIHVDEDT